MRQVLLRRRPVGLPVPEDFEIVDLPAPALADGDVLRRTIYLSLDPYMRGRMSDEPSYAAPVAVGQAMVGHTVSQVVESRNPAFAAGDFVTGYDGWREGAVSKGADLRKLDPSLGDFDGDWRARHAGHDRVCRAARHRTAEAGRNRGRVGGVGGCGVGRRPDCAHQGVPRGRRGRIAREVRVRGRRARLRRVRQLQERDVPRRPRRGLSARHRRVLRECRRRGAGGGAPAR